MGTEWVHTGGVSRLQGLEDPLAQQSAGAAGKGPALEQCGGRRGPGEAADGGLPLPQKEIAGKPSMVPR